MRRTALALLLVAVAACGGDGDADTTAPLATDPPATETTVAAPATPAPTETTVPAATAPTDTTVAEEPGDDTPRLTIGSMSFGAAPTVSVGEELEVLNNDGFAHTWTSDDGVFNSGSIGPGSSFRHTFEEAGTYPFFCSFHPEMRGSITVQG